VPFFRAKNERNVFTSSVKGIVAKTRECASVGPSAKSVQRQIVSPNSPSMNCNWASGSPLPTHLARLVGSSTGAVARRFLLGLYPRCGPAAWGERNCAAHN
jgi:hypothetical protein